MVGEVRYDRGRKGHHAARNYTVSDPKGEKAGEVVGEAPEVYYQRGKEAAWYHDGHPTDSA